MPTAIVMPSLGMYTIEGEITRWLVPSGAAVERDQPVLELTTEKAAVEINAPAAGILHHVLSLGGRVQVQGLMGYVLAPGEAAPPHPPTPLPTTRGEGVLRTAGGHAVVPGPMVGPPGDWSVRPPPVSPSPLVGEGPGVRGTPAAELRVSPLARRRAAELGVDLTQITGTGPGGRITEVDVEAAAQATRPESATGRPPVSPSPLVGEGLGVRGRPTPPSPAPPTPVLHRIPLTGMRGMIARRMHQSLATTAQLTLTRAIDATPLVAARDALGVAAPGVRVSFDVLLARALAAALLEHPALNAVVEGDEILVLAEAHVGVAVAVPDGLVVPVLRDPAHRPARDLARELERLVARAREGHLRPEDMEGGTVTLTNLGAYAVDVFTPILNPPQSAILGVGCIALRPFVDADGQLGVRPTVHLSLTFDHRVADGAAAATLLDAIVTRCAAPVDV